MKRRAMVAGTKGVFRFGDGDKDVNRSLSNVKKDDAVAQLKAHDEWRESKGLDPEWKFAPQGTPEGRRLAHEAKKAAAAEVESQKKRVARSSADAARLIFILFTDEMYTRLLLSEQPPSDRNKRDLKQLGVKDPEGVWDDAVDHYLDKDLVLGGVTPGNPTYHGDSTAPGVDKMWEVLQSLDYKEPVDK